MYSPPTRPSQAMYTCDFWSPLHCDDDGWGSAGDDEFFPNSAGLTTCAWSAPKVDTGSFFLLCAYRRKLAISRGDVTLVFKGVDAHATSESYLGGKSLSLLAAWKPTKYDPDRQPFKDGHPGVEYSCLAWGAWVRKRRQRRSARIRAQRIAQQTGGIIINQY